jgi:putative transposase
VINRGNGRARVFHNDRDYQSFLNLIGKACTRLPLDVLACCLMPNHFHLVLKPHEDGDLGRWMHWLMTVHVRRYQWHYGSSGHIWQGRFKAFPIQRNNRLLQVMRYVERNALRANLVGRAEDWPWGSLAWRFAESSPEFLVPSPMALPADWVAVVNAAQSATELEALRRSVNRGTPYGDGAWVSRTARELGLEASLRRPGRPPA